MQLRVQNLLLALEQIVREELGLHVLKPKALDGLGKPLARLALLPEQKNGLLNNIEGLLLIRKDLAQRTALGHLLAPAAANIDLIPIGTAVHGVKVALVNAPAAVVADALVDLRHAVAQRGRAHGAGLDHAALLAPVALVRVQVGDPLADNAQIVQIRLDAVVGTAAYGNLELVGQADRVVALVEPVVNLLAEGEGVQQAVLAGGALAGHHGPHQGAGAAGDKALPGDVGPEILDLVVGDALDLNGQAGGEGDIPVAELLRRLGNALLLGSGDLAVDGDDAAGEVVGALVAEKSQRLDPLLIGGADG